MIEYELLGDILLMTLISFFGLALPGYALVRRIWPESDWNLSGGVSTSTIQALDLVVVGGFCLLFGANWKMLKERTVETVTELPTFSQVLGGSFGYLIIAAFIPAVLFWRINLMEFFGIRWDRWKRVFWIMPAFVIAMMVVGALMKLGGWQGWIEATYGAKQQTMVMLMKNSSDFALLGAIIISAVIIAPIAEEVIFRGYIYPVVKRYSEHWFAALFSGLLFGVVHFNMMGLPLLVVIGVVLVILYEKTGSLWVTIGCHAAFNATNIGFMLLDRV